MSKIRLSLLPVWAFNAVLVALATGIGLAATKDAQPIFRVAFNHEMPFIVTFALVVAVVAACESCMFSIPYRSDSQTFSLAELSLFLGIAFVPPEHFLPAQACAYSLIHLRRHSPPVRALFNVASSGLIAACAYWVTNALTTQFSSPAQQLGGIAFAVLVGAPIGSFLVATVRSIAERTWLFQGAPMVAAYSTFAALVNSALAALIAVTAAYMGLIALVGVFPIAATYLALRRFIDERTKRTNVEFLYETTKAFHRTSDFEEALVEFLERARTVFRSEYAELSIRRSDTGSWLRFTVGAPGRAQLTDDSYEPAWIPDGASAQSFDIRNGSLASSPLKLLESIGARNAMVSTLRRETQGDSELLGVLLLSDRVGVEHYLHEHLGLFELLATQLSIALENGHLERSLGQLTRLEQELRFQAHHDSLTGLANRAGLAASMRELTNPSRAVLLIDLNGFKLINDTLGHDVGDEVLVEVARRLRTAVDNDGVVARLGGDEFVVLLPNVTDAKQANEWAEDVSQALQPSIVIGDAEVFGRGSVGAAFSDTQESMTELLRQADVAMYEAKRKEKANPTAWLATPKILS